MGTGVGRYSGQQAAQGKRWMVTTESVITAVGVGLHKVSDMIVVGLVTQAEAENDTSTPHMRKFDKT